MAVIINDRMIQKRKIKSAIKEFVLNVYIRFQQWLIKLFVFIRHLQYLLNFN